MKPEQAPGKPLPDNGAKWPEPVWIHRWRENKKMQWCFSTDGAPSDAYAKYIPEAQAQADKAEAVAAAKKEGSAARDKLRCDQIMLRADLTELLEATKSLSQVERIAEARESAQKLLKHIYDEEKAVVRESAAGEGT
jgi:hypothetical protein